RPDLEADDIAAALKSSADKISDLDKGYGAGILSVARAVSTLRLGVTSRTADTVAVQPNRPTTADVPPAPPLPSESRRWYFAEGSTRTPFDVSFALQNPNTVVTTAHFLFLTADGKPTP